jgi:hypothetical protein
MSPVKKVNKQRSISTDAKIQIQNKAKVLFFPASKFHHFDNDNNDEFLLNYAATF